MNPPRPFTLPPFEHALLATIAQLEDRGEPAIYGSLLVRYLPPEQHPQRFVRSGWLYRALGHLVAVGLLDAWLADAAGLPPAVRPRRCYRVTAAGRALLSS